MTVGVWGRDSSSLRNPSMLGLIGVMLLLMVAGVDGAGEVVVFLGGAVAGVVADPAFPGVKVHSFSSTVSPPRHLANSASKAAMYF